MKPSGSDSTPSTDTVGKLLICCAWRLNVCQSYLLKVVVMLWFCAVAGIWHHVFDSSNKIKEIWFLRQLSHDELESKVSKRAAVLCVGRFPRYTWACRLRLVVLSCRR